MIRRMNKKADLMNNTLEIIVAVVGLLIIIGGIYLLYQHYANAESESAKNTINVLEAKINAVGEGQTANVLIQGFDYKYSSSDPSRWYIMGWGKNDIEKPGKCLDSCICICKLDDFNDFKNRALDSTQDELNEAGIQKCQDNGFCRVLDGDIVNIHRVSQIAKNNKAPLSKILAEGFSLDKLPVSRSDKYITLREGLVEVTIRKSVNGIEVYNDNPVSLEYAWNWDFNLGRFIDKPEFS